MLTRPCRPRFRHYAFTGVLASTVWLTTACAAHHAIADTQPFRGSVERLLTFENSTTEPVRLYLAERSLEWFVGQVEAGETALLRLPAPATLLAGREFSLIAVPSSTRRSLARVRDAGVGPVRIEPLPGDYLTSVRWRLDGRWLVPMPLIRGH